MTLKEKNLLFLFLVFLTVIAFISSNKSRFFYAHEVFKRKYLNSQWVIPNSKTPISDEELYIYAGNEYIRGTSPILVNPEILPLPKYVIGLITRLTGNPYFTGAIFYFFALVFLFEILETFKAGLFRKIFVLTLGFVEILREGGFLSALIEPFLLFFFLGGVYFYLKRRLVLSSLFFALFINSKNFLVYFSLLFLTFTADILHSFFKGKNWHFKVKLFFTTILFSFIFLYLSYFKVLIDTGDVLAPLRVQKYIFSFYKNSAKVPPFMAVKMIFLNQWHVWWADKIKSVPGWWFFWPLSLLLFTVKILKNKKLNFLIFWILFYFAFLNLIPVWPRYFLLLFIPVYIIIFGKNISI